MMIALAAVIGCMIGPIFAAVAIGGMSLGQRKEQLLRDRETDRLRGEGYVVGVHGPEIFDADA